MFLKLSLHYLEDEWGLNFLTGESSFIISLSMNYHVHVRTNLHASREYSCNFDSFIFCGCSVFIIFLKIIKITFNCTFEKRKKDVVPTNDWLSWEII